jgi:hypothetical protein
MWCIFQDEDNCVATATITAGRSFWDADLTLLSVELLVLLKEGGCTEYPRTDRASNNKAKPGRRTDQGEECALNNLVQNEGHIEKIKPKGTQKTRPQEHHG